MKISQKTRNGFTLIELLVVISIIALLSSVILAALSGARQKAVIASGEEFSSNMYHAFGNNILGMWGSDQCSGTVINDSSGNNYNFNTSNSVSFSQITPSYNGCSLSFDGNYSIVTTNGPTSYPNGVSISLWIYPKNITTVSQGLFSELVGGTLDIFAVGNGKIRFEYSNSTNFQSNQLLQNNQWYQIFMTYDPNASSNNAKIYINGNLDSESSTQASPPTIGTGDITLGNYYGYYNGLMNDIKLYSTGSISAIQIKHLYAEGLKNHQNLAEK